MTKLHELLAAESGLETQAIKVNTDLKTTFEKKRHLFEEKKTIFTSNEEGKPQVEEFASNIQTTIRKELGLISVQLAKALDAAFQVAETNTKARADIILEDENAPLVQNVPATALLELEKKLTDWVLNLLQVVPTLDPARSFTEDDQKGRDIYRARTINKTRTRKNKKVIVKYDATPEHPAQTELIDIDEPVGHIEEFEWSGLVTPDQKSEMLDRAEQLIRAVRKARSRANEAEVDVTKKIGKVLLNYVFEGKK